MVSRREVATEFFRERNIPKREQRRYLLPEMKLRHPIPLRERLAELWRYSDDPRFACDDADRRRKEANWNANQNRE